MIHESLYIVIPQRINILFHKEKITKRGNSTCTQMWRYGVEKNYGSRYSGCTHTSIDEQLVREDQDSTTTQTIWHFQCR